MLNMPKSAVIVWIALYLSSEDFALRTESEDDDDDWKCKSSCWQKEKHKGMPFSKRCNKDACNECPSLYCEENALKTDWNIEYKPPKGEKEYKVDIWHSGSNGENATDRRAMMVFHGSGGNKASYAPLCGWFAVQGFVTFCFDRGEEKQMMESFKWTREKSREYGVDPAQIFVHGFSAGGALVATMLLDDDTHVRTHAAGVLLTGGVKTGMEDELKENTAYPPVLMAGDLKDDQKYFGNAPDVFDVLEENNQKVGMLNWYKAKHTDCLHPGSVHRGDQKKISKAMFDRSWFWVMDWLNTLPGRMCMKIDSKTLEEDTCKK